MDLYLTIKPLHIQYIGCPRKIKSQIGLESFSGHQYYGIEVQIFDYLEANANEVERKEGYDIADYLLKVKPDEAVLQQMIRRNPAL